MKRTICIVGLAAMFLAAACGKDEDTSSGGNATPAGGNQPVALTGEGIYSPAHRIEHNTDYRAGQSRVWMWGDSQLDAIADDGDCGALPEEKVRFHYSGQRVSSIDFTDGYLAGTVGFDYGGDYIDAFSLQRDALTLVTGMVEHNADHKVNRLSLSVDSSYVGELLDALGDLAGDFPLPSSVRRGSHPSKLAFSGASAIVDFAWQGANVSSAVLTFDFAFSVTLSELVQMVEAAQLFDLTSLFGSQQALDMAMLMFGSTEIPVSVSLADTIEYSYDSHVNPLRGLLSEMSVAMLSANNVVAEHTHGTASISISLPMLPTGPVSRQWPVPTTSRSYSIEYTSDGLPAVITDDEEFTKEYEYKN